MLKKDKPFQTMAIKRLIARVLGRVQGVGFRYFVARRARQLGLTGWVRNEPDGSVLVVAEGPEDKLQELLDSLYGGPPAARVEHVAYEFELPTGEFRDFSIRF